MDKSLTQTFNIKINTLDNINLEGIIITQEIKGVLVTLLHSIKNRGIVLAHHKLLDDYRVYGLPLAGDRISGAWGWLDSSAKWINGKQGAIFSLRSGRAHYIDEDNFENLSHEIYNIYAAINSPSTTILTVESLLVV